MSGVEYDSLLMTPEEQALKLEEQVMFDHPQQVPPGHGAGGLDVFFSAQLPWQRTFMSR